MIDGYNEAPSCSSFTSGSFDIDVIFHVHCIKPVWCVTVVEAMTGQMAWIADSTRSVSRSNDRLSAGRETFFEECRFFTSEFIVSEEESEGEVDPEEIDQELEELQKVLEEQEGPAPCK